MKTIFISILLLVMLLAGNVNGQVNPSKTLSLEAAKKIAAAARKFAQENKAPGGSIAIVDAGGELIYLERLDNTFAASALVAYDKAHTAAMFRFPSQKLEDAIGDGRNALITVGYNMLEGGIPISYEGTVIGAIGVSGSASAKQDVEIAEAAAKSKFD